MLKASEICDAAIDSYTLKTKKTFIQTFIAACFAGAFIALGGFGASVGSYDISNTSLSKLAAGLIFPVGLMLVIICGAELFTGNSLLIVPLLEKNISLKDMIKNWSIVYCGNLIGSLAIVFLIYNSGLLSMSSGKLGSYAIKIAAYKSTLPFWKALSSGILCNFIVALTVWASLAAKNIAGKIAIIWFPIMTFVVCGFEHSIANMYYLFLGLFAKSNPAYTHAYNLTPEKIASVNISNIIHNLIPVTLGNIIGGSLLIGAAFWTSYKYIPRTKQLNTNI